MRSPLIFGSKKLAEFVFLSKQLHEGGLTPSNQPEHNLVIVGDGFTGGAS